MERTFLDAVNATPFLPETLVILFGLLVGSFSNVCIHRMPRDQSVVKPRSRCPACETGIAWYDNVPVVSFLLLRGKCRHCSARISVRYPLIEMASALVSWLVFYRFGLGWAYLIYYPFSAALLIVSLIDLDHRIIPDEISLGGIVLGLVLALTTPVLTIWNSLGGLLLGGGFLLLVATLYEAVRKQDGMGGGDIKLLGMIGAFTGWQGALFTIFGGSIIASVVGITLMVAKGEDGRLALPFGPFISAAAFVYVLYGPQLIQAYTGLLGP